MNRTGYAPSACGMPRLLMLQGGGRSLEDLRTLRADEGLRTLLGLTAFPGSDTAGDWLRRLGVLAYNLFQGFKHGVSKKEWRHHQVQTIRWRLYQTAGKVVRHAGRIYLKVRDSVTDLFADIRRHCGRLAAEACSKYRRPPALTEKNGYECGRDDAVRLNQRWRSMQNTRKWRQTTAH